MIAPAPKRQPLARNDVGAIVAAVAGTVVLPYAEEFWRCYRADRTADPHLVNAQHDEAVSSYQIKAVIGELTAAGIDFQAYVLRALEEWPVPSDSDPKTRERCKIRRLTDLRLDAEGLRREQWAHDPENEWRLPDNVPWSYDLAEMVELFQRAAWRPNEHAARFAQYLDVREEDLERGNEIDEAVELMLKAGNAPVVSCWKGVPMLAGCPWMVYVPSSRLKSMVNGVSTRSFSGAVGCGVKAFRSRSPVVAK